MVPIAALIWGTLAAGATLRTFYHWHRAVVYDGHVVACAGENNCDPAMVIQATSGSTPVFANASGRVIAVTPNSVQIASQNEPVILVYENVQPQVALGESVGIGQQVALGQLVRFSVVEVYFQPGGQVALAAVEPASWLAARGQTISCKKQAVASWCAQGRKIQTPKAVANCGLKLPVPGGFMLLPVSVISE